MEYGSNLSVFNEVELPGKCLVWKTAAINTHAKWRIHDASMKCSNSGLEIATYWGSSLIKIQRIFNDYFFAVPLKAR